jgi:predicted secreted protein
MSGMSFELAPETVRGAEDALTADALRRLRDRAQRIAGSLQAQVLGIKDLRVGNADAQQPHPPMPFALAASARKMPTPAAEAGEATVRVTVEADFLLGQPGAGKP